MQYRQETTWYIFFCRNVSTCTFFQWTWVENLSRCSSPPMSCYLMWACHWHENCISVIRGLIHNRIILIDLFKKDGIATCFMNSRECVTRLSVNNDVFIFFCPSHKTCVTSEDLNCVTTFYYAVLFCTWQPRFSFTWESMIFRFPQK